MEAAGKKTRPAAASARDRWSGRRGAKDDLRKTVEIGVRQVGGNRMTGNQTPLEAAHASVKTLISEKLRYLVPMTVIFMVGYIGLTALAGFARDLMGSKVVGSLNLGFVLIAFNYLLSWVLAIVYGRVAAEKFDPLAAKAAAAIMEAEKPQ
jgi:uncharacterized membrane protein (DUF485 family)